MKELKNNYKIKIGMFLYYAIFIILLVILSINLYIFLLNNFPKISILRNFVIRDFGIITLVCIFTMIALLFLAKLIRRKNNEIQKNKIETLYKKLETAFIESTREAPIGVVVYDENFQIEWLNDFFSFEQKKALHNMDLKTFIKEKEDKATSTSYENMRILHDVFEVYHAAREHIIYFVNQTEKVRLQEHFFEETPVIGYIYVDSPEEVRVIEDGGGIDASSEIHRLIYLWAKQYKAYVRKYSTYRWMIILNQSKLLEMIRDKMCIRSDIEKLGQNIGMDITISGGFAVYNGSFEEAVRQSIESLELAQSRGGDQIVIYAENKDFKIFGGKAVQKKRLSRVMVRSFGNTLHNEMIDARRIFVTGHHFADLDAVGGMLGIYSLAKAYQKECYFIIDYHEVTPDVKNILKLASYQNLVEEILQPNLIMPHQLNEKTFEADDLVIILDTTVSELLESPYILTAPKYMTIDHHRKGKNAISGFINYVDSYSSSVSEMVAELLQYQPHKIMLSKEIATFLLGGIILDTNQFTRNTTSRTYEAAAFLKKYDAQQNIILESLGTSMEDYLKQASYLELAEQLPKKGSFLYLNHILPRQKIARMSDFLLSFPDIHYAIVGAKINNEFIALSARSKGNVNVQKIMERMGGGGHFNNAATQIPLLPKSEIKKLIEEIIVNLEID